MIPQRFITAWQQKVPWRYAFQVEQDLLISRALIEIYKIPYVEQDNANITRALFEKNLFEKISSPLFLKDMEPLLSKENKWDPMRAYENMMLNCMPLLRGQLWKGLKA